MRDRRAAAAADLATTTTTYFRKSGTFATLPPRDEATTLLARTRELAGPDTASTGNATLVDLGLAM